MIAYTDIKRLSRKGNVIPVFERIPSDLETPVATFIKLAANKKNAFLLESIEGGEKLARYSFIGYDPFLAIEGDLDTTVLKQGKSRKELPVPAHEVLTELFKVYKPVRVPGLPRFTGGGVGYFSYDTVRWVEDIPDNNPDEIGLPDVMLGIYSRLVVFDHLKQELIVIANILHESGEKGLRAKYDEAVTSIRSTIKKLSGPLRRPRPAAMAKHRISVRTERKTFESSVRKARRYIKEGDIFQVVLSQRWQVTSNRTPLDVYRRLRRINPSPYMFLLNFDKCSVVGSSPEMMVRIENGDIETRPIAGTRPRGKNDIEDDKRIADLMADEKELAEHTMLLDLGRNDLGRVSKPGTVRINDRMIVEKYSHVIHIVSSVVGKLQRGQTALDGLFSCFPAGTVSGAPKIRAMEIIDEMEPVRRGVYAGAVAYLDFYGNLDSCISIRTIVRKDQDYYIQAGAGIVADSKPAREFKETEAKAGALMEAIVGEDSP